MDILYLLIGWLSGIILCSIYNKLRVVGYLRIDTSNPEKDYYLIDISKDLDKLNSKKSIILKIDNKYRKTQ